MNTSAGVLDLRVKLEYETLIEQICIHNFSIATSIYLGEWGLWVDVTDRMKSVILAVISLVVVFLSVLYLNLQPNPKNTLEGGIARVLRIIAFER